MCVFYKKKETSITHHSPLSHLQVLFVMRTAGPEQCRPCAGDFHRCGADLLRNTATPQKHTQKTTPSWEKKGITHIYVYI